MKHRTFHFDWHWDLRSSPEAFWPYIADTNRFNRDTGLPSLTLERKEGLGNARRLLQFYRMGFKMEWEEEPFEWVRPHRFSVVRRYRAGPIAEMRATTELTPNPNGGTHLRYQVWATPKYWFGYIGIPMQIGVLSARAFDKAIRHYDEIASSAAGRGPLPESGIRFAPGGRERMASARTILLQSEDADLVDRLIEVIQTHDDMSVARIRPYALADEWQAPRRRVLELCLAATRAGLLEFQWELLCPLCRGPKQQSKTLRDVTSDVHCDACHIDFTVNFERSVELTFHPSPTIRPLDVHPYCIGGPMVTPHIVAQQFVQPGETVEVSTHLDLGRHRVRTYALPGGQHLLVADTSAQGNAAHEIELRAFGDKEWPASETVIAPDTLLHLHNATNVEQLFIVERMAWSDQAATAAEVTALQVFRDLFSSEALRPGEKISVGTLAVIFTDLRESTRLYREIGDAPAFGMVMSHFDALREAVVAEEGAIVKTMGDSVMAVFRRPLAAMRAIFRAQSLLAKSNYGRNLRLKAGVHFGPCIAVNLNDRLDYFGSTINIAARLESLSSGSDVIISGAVRSDPEVAAFLATPETVAMEPVQAVLKGFEAEPIELWRVAHLSG